MATQDYVATQIALAKAEWDLVLSARDEAWELALNDTKDSIAQNSQDMDAGWIVICGAMVFFMQCGFAMLEAGIVHPKNVANILFKVFATSEETERLSLGASTTREFICLLH